MDLTRSPKTFFVAALGSLASLALGWCLGARVARERPRPERADAPLARASAALAPASPDPAPAAAFAEPPRLSARSAELPPAADAAQLALESALVPSVSGAITDELRAFLRSGVLEAQLAADPDELLTWMELQYAEAGRAQEALAMLRRHPTESAYVYSRIGAALLAAGDRAAAAEAYLSVLDREPLDGEAIEALRGLDPAGALARIEARASELDLLPGGEAAVQRARLLAALGRKDEAIAFVGGALESGVLDLELWRALAELDPTEAERRLRERRAGDDTGTLDLALARVVARDESRRAEAVELLVALLDRQPANEEALERLAELDPGRLAARFDPRAPGEAPGWVWSSVGERLAEEGRQADAVEAWMLAIAADASDAGAIEGVLERAPARIFGYFQSVTPATTDDELLGDAADFYWGQGRQEEALALWRRANLIDPGDSEWTSKLHKALAGVDPLE